LRAALTFAIVGAAMAFVFFQMNPSLLLANTTPAGGDMGAHVWGPAFLRDHLLRHGRISGWAPDWYAGFPAYLFYFPLPSLLIVLGDLALPYGVAFKLVTVSGLVALPLAAWAFGRLARLPFPAPPLLAVATLPFIFDQYHTIWGGNAPSALAGEFAFSVSLAFAVLFLGVVARGLDTGGHRALAALLLGLTALSHLLPTVFAAVGAGMLFLTSGAGRRRLGYITTVGGLGAALAGFWLLPFAIRLPYSNDMGWSPTTAYLENLLPFLREDIAGAATVHLKFVVPFAALGAVLAVAHRRRPVMALAGTALFFAAAFRFFTNGPIWNARALPFWYLCLYLLAAVAVAETALSFGRARGAKRKHPTFIPALVAIASFVAVIVVVGGPLGALPPGLRIFTGHPSFVPSWASWNYSGFERKASYPEYRTLIETMARVGEEQGCGRAMWEYEPEQNRYGTPMALMLLPYWTGGCIGSMEGLYFES
ncbi:MAG: 6-pyruvoyl-tetrahydropterin synthase-related protein, partial [Acidimicrobiales bacterium]